MEQPTAGGDGVAANNAAGPAALEMSQTSSQGESHIAAQGDGSEAPKKNQSHSKKVSGTGKKQENEISPHHI